jgi:aconitate hydratase
VPVLLSLGDDVSTDEILPAGAKVLPLRSNLPAIAEYTFHRVDPGYLKRAREVREGQGNGSHGSGASHASSASHGSSTSGNSSDSGSDSGSGNGHGKSSGGHAVVAGDNYGQGSSREHAALAPRYLGLRLVLASSFSRIHWQNLINFGVLPLRFEDPSQRDRIQMGDRVVIEDLWSQLRAGAPVEASLHKGSAGAASSGAGATPSSAAFSGASATPSSAASSGAGAASTSAGEGEPLRLTHDLSMRKIDQLQAGGVIGWIRQEE